MSNKIFLQKLGFIPKENASGIFYKNYKIAEGYCIEVNIEKKRFNFGDKIKFGSKATQNFFQEENWVVFECVNHLLEKGYKPEDIILEKIYPTGHGTSGRLDILVKKNKRAYLMIECKIWGNEFEKAFRKMQKNGGQLFTYFQQDRNAEYLMLYTSNFDGKNINYENEIIKIEEHYKDAGNVKDLYDRWNKLAKQNGIFDDWVSTYEFQSKALTRKDLEIIKQEDSSFIFNRFLEILRHNVVSDKPNAFNKIFTLFLCKIIDEDKSENKQLHFQWLEGEDDNISFQKRLTDLYKRGMNELLEKKVKDLSDDDFNNKYQNIDESIRKKILDDFTEIRLKKNNEFAFKEVFDDSSFEDNAKVVKEVVELLQGYQIRYNKKHQYLGDFFELLLTTGLKQESGQFFTPVPVAKYIIKSLPIKEIVDEKIREGNSNDLLPFTIDYAAGSGHFLTESMEEVQNIIDRIDENKLNPKSSKKIKSWKDDQYDWAFDYVYGIEKDYRLVKTAKVGCYLHGDGLAKVIHSDGLSTFNKTPEYKGKLKEIDRDFLQDNKQFDVVISNPPYSVSAFKGMLNEENAKESFELFPHLSDQSSEIECLFVERTKQLLKDGRIAGIILPSSVLSNAGIYTKTRDILLKYFEIIAITELGSGTFMATGTNTVILFLRRRTNYEWENIQLSIDKFFQNFQDVTVNEIENIFSKYANFVWEDISFEDYISLIQNKPNKNIQKNEIYIEYKKKIKVKNEEDLQKKIIEIEAEKLLYFILAYPQKVVIVKSGERKEEKLFLGYEFSTRRGSEGIHPIQRGKTIDECTKLFDPEKSDNSQKASTYVLDAFNGNFRREIDGSLSENISRVDLIDMMSFDRVDFEKTISLALKKTLKIESKWDIIKLGDVCAIDWGNTNLTKTIFEENGKYDVFSATGRDGKANIFEHNETAIILSAIGARCGKCFWATGKWTAIKNTIVIKTANKILLKYLYQQINSEDFWDKSGKAQPFITLKSANNQKIPLPPKNIQKKIVSEIEKIEKKEGENKKRIKKLNSEIDKIIEKSKIYKKQNFGKIAKELFAGGDLPKNRFSLTKTEKFTIPIYSNSSQNKGLYGYTDIIKVDKPCITISARGTIGYTKVRIDPFYPIVRLLVLIPKKELAIIKYLEYAIRRLNLNQFGTTTPQLTVPQFENFKIPLPPLSEQKKIVTQIIKIENQISKLEQELKNIKKEKTEVLKKYL